MAFAAKKQAGASLEAAAKKDASASGSERRDVVVSRLAKQFGLGVSPLF